MKRSLIKRSFFLKVALDLAQWVGAGRRGGGGESGSGSSPHAVRWVGPRAAGVSWLVRRVQSAPAWRLQLLGGTEYPPATKNSKQVLYSVVCKSATPLSQIILNFNIYKIEFSEISYQAGSTTFSRICWAAKNVNQHRFEKKKEWTINEAETP